MRFVVVVHNKSFKVRHKIKSLLYRALVNYLQIKWLIQLGSAEIGKPSIKDVAHVTFLLLDTTLHTQ